MTPPAGRVATAARANLGSFVFAYERRVTVHHAVRVAGDFVHVHHAADHVQAHQWTFGGTLGYRDHLHPAGGVVDVELSLAYAF